MKKLLTLLLALALMLPLVGCLGGYDNIDEALSVIETALNAQDTETLLSLMHPGADICLHEILDDYTSHKECLTEQFADYSDDYGSFFFTIKKKEASKKILQKINDVIETAKLEVDRASITYFELEATGVDHGSDDGLLVLGKSDSGWQILALLPDV